MLDVERWILTEAWLANGLRIRWNPSYGPDAHSKEWQEDEERRRYRYAGDGTWEVRDEDGTGGRTNAYYTKPEAPQLSTPTMRHELAHWLTSNDEERAQVNFGLKADDRDGEEKALMAERVISALVQSSARIAQMALGAPTGVK